MTSKHMNTTNKAIRQILAAAKTPRPVADLIPYGVVPGEFGLTAWGAAQLIKSLINSGDLKVSYDSCHCRLLQS